MQILNYDQLRNVIELRILKLLGFLGPGSHHDGLKCYALLENPAVKHAKYPETK